MTTSAATAPYDFLDLGASGGGSLSYCETRFGGTGLGVDLAPRKVEAARAAGHNVVLGDARDLKDEDNSVRYVAAMDFLEHLADTHAARAILASAARVATDFIFIRHPSFEGEAMLRSLGLRQYWHNWSGHPNHMRVSDFCEALDALGLHRYAIHYLGRVEDSSDPTILPLGTPRNSHAYDPEVHPPKPALVLPEPVWRAQHIYVALRDFEPGEWEAIVREP